MGANCQDKKGANFLCKLHKCKGEVLYSGPAQFRILHIFRPAQCANLHICANKKSAIMHFFYYISDTFAKFHLLVWCPFSCDG